MAEDSSDWRGAIIERVRKLIREADPDVVETVKWRKPSNPDGIPVWEHAGLICGAESYKNYVKVTFAQGAKLDDPTGMLDPGNAKPAPRSTSNKATSSTPRRSRRWSGRRWSSTRANSLDAASFGSHPYVSSRNAEA